jgi:hypothetical protein
MRRRLAVWQWLVRHSYRVQVAQWHGDFAFLTGNAAAVILSTARAVNPVAIVAIKERSWVISKDPWYWEWVWIYLWQHYRLTISVTDLKYRNLDPKCPSQVFAPIISDSHTYTPSLQLRVSKSIKGKAFLLTWLDKICYFSKYSDCAEFFVAWETFIILPFIIYLMYLTFRKLSLLRYSDGCHDHDGLFSNVILKQFYKYLYTNVVRLLLFRYINTHFNNIELSVITAERPSAVS